MSNIFLGAMERPIFSYTYDRYFYKSNSCVSHAKKKPTDYQKQLLDLLSSTYELTGATYELTELSEQPWDFGCLFVFFFFLI